MNKSLANQHSSGFLVVTISMIICMIVLINVSFKIVTIKGLVFTVSSLLCPMIAGLFLLSLRICTFKEQRHVLNIALMTLYLFCVGVYVLVNLPAAEYMHDNPVYQIIFEDIPKKFFATTIAFVLSFYLPHLLFCTRTNSVLVSAKQCVLLSLLGGVSFLCMDFFLLFSGTYAHDFKQIFIDSLIITTFFLLLIGVGYLSFLLNKTQTNDQKVQSLKQVEGFPLYYYLLCFSVAIMLMCLACEYRIVAFSKGCMITASSIFFPITLMISTLIGELWGYKANLKMAVVLIGSQCFFDGLLMGLIALPSPPFFNLNPFYSYIMPRRLPAASFALFVTFISNAMLLQYLPASQWLQKVRTSAQRPLCIFIANVVANSLLCLVNYGLLFGGIYPYEQIINLAINVWVYKLVITVISIPIILWCCQAVNTIPFSAVFSNRR